MVVEILCGYFRCNLNGSPFVRDAQRSPCKEEAYRLPYVKYSTGANKTTRTVYRALGKPDQAAARRAFLTGRAIGEWHTETKCLFRRVSAISHPSASFLPILFWQDRKEWAAGGTPRHSGAEKIWPAERRMRLRKPHRASGAKDKAYTP